MLLSMKRLRENNPSEPSALRQSTAALALIRREVGPNTLWLVQWNRKWACYNFVGGHTHDGESFCQCVAREITEELSLVEGQDFNVASEPAAHSEYTAWSVSAQQETHYTIELFDVRLRGEQAGEKIDADPLNRWLTEIEIRERRCHDGQPVSETMALLLRKAGLFTIGEDGISNA